MTSSPSQPSRAPFEVVRLTTPGELQPWRLQWNALSRDIPFCRWEWLEGWWRHYGQSAGHPRRGRELYVLAVIDATQSLVALAPWYLERSAPLGRVVRFLGGGEVCSEYLSLLAREGDEEAAAKTLAEWLTREGASQGADRWDAIKLIGVERDNLTVGRLLGHLAKRGQFIERRSGLNCWRLSLPATWEQYLAILSKCHRKQLRRLDRDYFRSGRAVVHWVHQPRDLERALAILVDLHQRRWQKRGHAGCFASPRFLEFHSELAARLLPQNGLLMNWLELDGHPIAAEYHLAAAGVVYAYQSGIDPESLAHQPGRLSNLAAIRRAIERGDRFFDFLRGDEPYKAHWRAAPRACYDAIIVPSRMSAR
ncbi:MAG TPA: GNAT family N-acetyltransferase, partial [Pirellulales bacterium]|nr:GNAT family N-acetyltransferase [Pirellulales bacterium]